jgi:DNA repair exonuclease SbcCD ATPase subunit
MPEEKKVDAENTEETQETLSLEVLQEQLSELKKQNEHLAESVKFHKEEARRAFEKRDEVKESLRTVTKEKQSSKEDLTKYVQDLETQLKEKDAKLQTIDQQRFVDKKLSILKDVARKQGMKETYLDRLDKFVDLDDIDPEKEISARIAVDTVRNSFPDLFAANSEAVDRALPNPKLSATGGDYKKQYQDLLSVPIHERKPDHFEKLAELKALMAELGQ